MFPLLYIMSIYILINIYELIDKYTNQVKTPGSKSIKGNQLKEITS